MSMKRRRMGEYQKEVDVNWLIGLFRSRCWNYIAPGENVD